MSTPIRPEDFSDMFSRAIYAGFTRVAQKVRSKAKTEYCPVAPAPIGGNLRSSIIAPVMTPYGNYPIIATLPAQATYAIFVHNGTYKMKKRPFFEYAVKDVNENDLDTSMAEGFAKVFG